MQKQYFKRIIEKYRDELAARIVKTVDQACSDKTIDNKELNSKILDILNDAIKRDSITESIEVTILLSDLRGFTAMSENYTPTFVIELLNRYFTIMNKIIVTKYGGLIDKFMGDSIMVLFGAPKSKGNDAERAINCALEMQIAMDDINAANASIGLPNLYMGIGINTGKVVAGNIGSELHSEYTVIGDEVKSGITH